mmetsp:Transcript_14470/g.28601  ORF Transcript_14470/g.28601 Transcript_14470/m.28601 type:complete len:218 (-) Transcript_14470:184-837(-)
MEWTEILEHEVPICEGLTSSPRPLAPLPSSATPPSRPPSPPPSPRHKTACTSHPRRAFCERQIVEFGRKDPNHTFVAGMKTMLMQHMCLRGEARREVEEKIVRVLDTVLASEQPPPLATHERPSPSQENPAESGGDASDATEKVSQEADSWATLSIDDILAASPRPPACGWPAPGGRASGKTPRSCLEEVVESVEEEDQEHQAHSRESRKKARKLDA